MYMCCTLATLIICSPGEDLGGGGSKKKSDKSKGDKSKQQPDGKGNGRKKLKEPKAQPTASPAVPTGDKGQKKTRYKVTAMRFM